MPEPERARRWPRATCIRPFLSWGLLSVAIAMPLQASSTEPFENVSQGGVVTGGFGSSAVGYDFLFDLGAESVGIRTFAVQAMLVQWDALLAARGGMLANEHPFMTLAGAQERGNVELGTRLFPLEAWSPYAGVRLDTDLTILTIPGVPIGKLNLYNNSDGVGGFTANGAARVAIGASWLALGNSVLLEAFFQEALRAPEVQAPGYAFSEGGVAVRWDLFQSLTLRIEGFAGRTPAIPDSALDYTEQTVHEELDADFRKTFRNGLWLGAHLNLSQETHVQAYLEGHAYPSTDAPTFGVTLVLGIPFGRQG